MENDYACPSPAKTVGYPQDCDGVVRPAGQEAECSEPQEGAQGMWEAPNAQFTAKDVAHRTLVVTQVPWLAPSPGVEGWLAS